MTPDARTMNRCKTMWLFTNRNVCAFDADGQQIVEYQRAMTCYRLAKKMALQATEEAEEFWIAGWGDWRMPLSRKEMQYLLGLRTRKMDLADMDQECGAIQEPTDD